MRCHTREQDREAAIAGGRTLDELVGFMTLVFMVGALIGFLILFDDGSPPPRQRPKHISKEIWKELEKSRRENYRRRGPETGGGGWSGGDGGD